MLIGTKLKAPALRSRLLVRKDLIKRLCAAEILPFVLISGPAGSGKSTLACQWLKETHIRTAWYSLDQEDNDPDLFYRYLLSAFINADEGLDELFGPMLRNRQRLTSELVIPHIIVSLSGANRKIHLVLDDFHHIKNEQILNALAWLMQYHPVCLQLVLLSRYSLPASMAAFFIKKDHMEITASDLKITETETSALFKRIAQVQLSPDQIKDLIRYFEGWAAGLQLVALSIRSKGSDFSLAHILNQTHEKVTGYLVHDILSMQPENIRT